MKLYYRNSGGEFISKRDWFKQNKRVGIPTTSIDCPTIITEEMKINFFKTLELAISGCDSLKVIRRSVAHTTTNDAISMHIYDSGSVYIVFDEDFYKLAYESRNFLVCDLKTRKEAFQKIVKYANEAIEKIQEINKEWDSMETESLA